MTYTSQTWTNNDPTTPLSAARLTHIEDGISAAALTNSPTFTGTVTLPSGTVSLAAVNGNYARNGNTIYRETMPWYAANAAVVALSSGVMLATGIYLAAGDSLTSISAISGSTALTQGSNNDGHWWFAAYDSTRTLIGQSADQTTTTWAGTTPKTLALTGGPFTVSSGQSGWGYVVIMVSPGTGGSPATPTLRGSTPGAQVSTGFANQKIACGTNGSLLTATAPGGPITIAATGNSFYAIIT